MDAITDKEYSISGHSGLVLKLYHRTDYAGLAGIHNTQMMKKGRGGMLGAGIYFAETPEEAEKKAERKGILLEVLVRVGWILVLTQEINPNLSKELLERVGCDSVKSIGHRSGPEYVVYDSDQVIAAWVVEGMPVVPLVAFPGPEWDDRPVCGMDGMCSRKNPQHFIEYKHLHPPVFPMERPPPEQKPLCPKGIRCRDKSIDHFKMRSHPKEVTLPRLPHECIEKPYRINPKCVLLPPQYFLGRPSPVFFGYPSPVSPVFFGPPAPVSPVSTVFFGPLAPVFWPPQ